MCDIDIPICVDHITCCYDVYRRIILLTVRVVSSSHAL